MDSMVGGKVVKNEDSVQVDISQIASTSTALVPFAQASVPPEAASTPTLPSSGPTAQIPSSPAPGANSHIIKNGDHVIFKMPSEQTRVYKVHDRSTINLGKFGSFPGERLLGHPFGLTYEIVGNKLKVMQPEVVKELEETQATNEYIEDAGNAVQPLTFEEIEALKKKGAAAQEIIDLQITSHANYELKTEFSKEKYKKRKTAKFSKTFTALAPSPPHLLDHLLAQQPSRVQHLRIDTLAQILTFANVKEGGRYVVVEDCGGLVVGSVLERMGGKGILLTIHDADSPPAHHFLGMMNLTPVEMEPLRVLNWATADESHTPIFPPLEANTTSKKSRSERERRRLDKRKEAIDLVLQTRQDLFAGEWDALIIVSQYEPLSIVNRLAKYVAGSGNLVVHSPYGSILAEAQHSLRQSGNWLNLQLTEGFLRQYQVLPGRTHPGMNQQGTGGWLLWGIRVFDDPEASSIVHWEVQAKKRRRMNEKPRDGGPSGTPAPDSAVGVGVLEAEPAASGGEQGVGDEGGMDLDEADVLAALNDAESMEETGVDTVEAGT